MKATIAELVEQEYEQAVERRHHLHRHPELSFQEQKTTRYIQNFLDEWQVPYTLLASGTGLVAWLTGELPGKTVAFRADIDALPMQEETGLDYASAVPGVMHGCGHDVHTANLLGFVHILSQNRDLIRGTVRFFFQPAEELFPGGARGIIREGFLEDVDAIYGLHVKPKMMYNEVSVRKGGVSAGSTVYKITIKGKGGHGSDPSDTIDPIVAAGGVITALQTVVSRNIHPLKSVVVSTCILRSGSKGNIIPDEAYMEGQIRCYEAELRDLTMKRIREIAEGVSQGYGCKAEVVFEDGYAPVFNHDENVDLVLRAVDKLPDLQLHVQPPRLGGEDFGYYLEKKPGAYFDIGIQTTPDQEVYSLHSPRIRIDDRALKTGMEMFLGIYLEECGL